MQFITLNSRDAFKGLIASWNKLDRPVAVDLETTGLNQFKDKILDLTVCVDGNTSYLLPPEFVLDLPLLTCLLVFHNFKFDYKMLYRAGVDLRGKRMRCTLLMHHLWNENVEHSLDSIVQVEYGDNYKERFWDKYKTYQEAQETEKREYACKDTIYTLLLYWDLMGRLQGDNGVPDSLVEHVHRLALALYDTEIDGLGIDLQYTTEIGTELRTSIEQHKRNLRAMSPIQCQEIECEQWVKEIDTYKTDKRRAKVFKPEFNFDSPDQLQRLLYRKLLLPIQKHPKTKQACTDDKALEKLEGKHVLIEPLRDYRKKQKVYNSFIVGTLERMHEGRIYPYFNINGTVTGRISSSDPNMQQLPSKGGWCKVRGIYIPDPGYKIITCDYSQLEVCVAAHFSLDKNLLKIIHEGASQHDITAEGLGVSRSIAKTINFAMQYGCTEYKISQILNCDIREAKHVLNKYWRTYPGLKMAVDRCHAAVDAGEPIINPFGRARHFPKEFDADWQRNAAYRQAFSSLIQGTGADITHEAYYTTAEELRQRGWGKALIEVHDEIVIMALIRACKEAAELLKSNMLKVGKRIGLKVPLAVQCSEPLDRWEK